MNRPAEPETGKPADGPMFFSTPELTQRVDLLRHLADNSELIPLVRAETGAGKTSMLYRLISMAGDNWEICRIDANPMMHPDQLMLSLVRTFGGTDLEDPTLDTVVEAAALLRAQGQLPLILVDDAHDLPPASLILLLRLSERRLHDTPVASIVLFADLKISQILVGPQFLAMNLQALHTLDIPRLRPAQIPRYVQFQLQAKGVDAIFPLEPGQAERLFKESAGLPGRIDELVMKMIKQSIGNKGRRRRSTGRLGDWLTVPRITVALSLLFLLAAALLFQDEINALFNGGSSTRPETSTPSLGSSRVGEPAATVENGTVDTRSLSLPIPEGGSGSSLAQPYAKDEGSTGETLRGRFDDPASRVTAAADDLLLPQVASSPAVGDAAQFSTTSTTEPTLAAESAVDERAKSAVAQSAAVVAKALQPKANEDPIAEPTKAEAVETKALQQDVAAPAPPIQAETPTPSPTPVAMPSVAQVEVVPPMPREEVRVEERDITSAHGKAMPSTVVKEDVPVPPTTPFVASVSEVTADQADAKGGLLGVTWLKAQNPAYFTLQLVSVSTEQALLDFAREQGVRRKGAYFRVTRNGKPIYSLVYGAYPSKDAAERGKAELPLALRSRDLWVRSMISVHQDIAKQ